MTIVLQPLLLIALLKGHRRNEPLVAFIPWTRDDFLAVVRFREPRLLGVVLAMIASEKIVCEPVDSMSDRKSWEAFSRFLADNDLEIPDWKDDLADDEYGNGRFLCRYHPSTAIAAMVRSGYFWDFEIIAGSTHSPAAV